MAWSVYTTEEGRRNVKTYKYHGTDKSLLANYVMQPFWGKAVNFLPLWMAPNLVTLLGFGFVILSFLITAFYHPNIHGTAPSWVYFLNALCMFIYQTMDALDGKQARRTGTSSPLGELFDHGCDAVTTVLQTLTIGCCLQMGSTNFILVIMVLHMYTFYLAQWEEFHTGEMILGYIGVTEAQIFSIIIYAWTGFAGTEFWNNYIHVGFGSLAINLRYGDFPCLVSGISTSFLAFSSIFTIVKKFSNSPKELEYSLLQLAPATLVSVSFYLWKLLSPSGIYERMPEAFLAAYGFLVATLVGKIVLARVCKQHISLFQVILVPLIVIPYAILRPGKLDEDVFVTGYCILAVGAYLHLAYSVIQDLCKTLKIQCLSIPANKAK